MIQIQVTESDSNIRLDRWFKRYYPNIPFIRIAKLIRKGEIKLNNKKTDIDIRLQYNDLISFSKFINKMLSENIENNITEKNKNKVNFEAKYPKLIASLVDSIIFENEDIIFINKPAKLATQGGSKVKVSLDDLSYIFHKDIEKNKDQNQKLKIVHRLDKDTSGLIMLAKNANAAAKLSEIIRNRSIEKTYIAILKGIPPLKTGFINASIYKEKEFGVKQKKTALTEYFVLDAYQQYSLVLFKLHTGRNHQLRIHSALELKSPILGDLKYSKNDKEEYLYLHSYGIKFSFNKNDIKVFADLPIYFVRKAQELNLNLHQISI